MDIIHFIADTITAALKHGWSLTTFILVIVALFRIQIIQSMLLRRLPRRFRHKDRLEIVEMKLDVIAAHMGVKGWDAHYLNGKTAHSVTVGQKNSLSKLSAASVRALITGAFTRIIKDSYHSKTKGENTQMKSKWLSRKFILAVAGCVVIILNDIMDLNVDKDTVFTFAGIIAAWIATEGVVDARKSPEVTDAYTTPKDAGNVQDTAN